MAKNKLRIALIDDGIEPEFSGYNKLEFDIEISEELNIIPRRINFSNFMSHGSNCAKIIHRYAPGASFGSIKILNDESHANVSQLIAAINWCINNDITIINLSLGTISCNDFSSVREIVNKAVKKGLFIIAACHNSDIISYPASLENVIGVKSDKKNRVSGNEFIYNLNSVDGIEITASIHYGILEDFIHSPDTPPENSYVVPHITAYVYKLLSENPNLSIHQIKKQLWEASKKQTSVDTFSVFKTRKIDWLDFAYLIVLGNHNRFLEDIEMPGIIVKRDFIKVMKISKDSGYNILDKIEANEFNNIILLLEDNIFSDAKTEAWFLSELMKLGKSIVYLNDTSELTNIENFGPQNRYWIPLAEHGVVPGSSSIMHKNNDVPIILINDFAEFVCSNWLKLFGNCFKSDDYFPVILSDYSAGILFGFEHIPNMINWDREPGLYNYFKKILRVHNPDLLIVLLDRRKQRHGQLPVLRRDLQPDIIINLNQEKTTLKGYSNSGNLNTINLFVNAADSILYFNNELKIFREVTAFEIYKQVVALFEKEKHTVK